MIQLLHENREMIAFALCIIPRDIVDNTSNKEQCYIAHTPPPFFINSWAPVFNEYLFAFSSCPNADVPISQSGELRVFFLKFKKSSQIIVKWVLFLGLST